MAGHSQFKNIMYRKGAQDAKKARLFTKLAREIMVAAREGQPDPSVNPRLRSAIAAARKACVSKDRIDMAIKKGKGELEGEHYEEIRYEGYGPGGVAFIIDALTDNRNRTASEVRAAFSKNGGNLGETGSVNFMFDRIGRIDYPARVAGAEAMFEAVVEAGAEDVTSDEDWHEVVTTPENFSAVREALVKKFGEPETAKLDWKPKDKITVDVEKAQKIMHLVEALEDLDDVQNVAGNYYISDDIANQLE